MKPYLAVVAAGWIVLAAAAAIYAQAKGVPVWIALPVAAAFLIEYAFYLIPGFAAVRRRIAGALPVRGLAAAMAASAVLPYLIASLGTGTFHFDNLLRLSVLAVFVSFWFVYRTPGWSSDLSMLAVLIAALVLKFFPRIYLEPMDGLRIDVLGQLMLIRTSAFAILEIREADVRGFGFWPTLAEWRIGLKYFLLFLPVGAALILLLKVSRFDPNWREAYLVPVTFAGLFWVVALSEEFLFRGLLQQRLEDWLRRPAPAILLSSVLFGLVHLGFGKFPNWGFAAVAAAAGLFYGQAYREASSIRASMVAHALTATAWRTLFS